MLKKSNIFTYIKIIKKLTYRVCKCIVVSTNDCNNEEEENKK